MKVYLSNKKCIDQSTKHCTNLAALDSIALDSEITNLVIDEFLSSFSFLELKEAMKIIVKKCRLNCEVTIRELDCSVIFRLYTRDEIKLEHFNNLFFQGVKKSILNTETIESCIPTNFSIQEKYISPQGLSTIKIRRIK
jgi:hypothetical protein|tara:strand:+ start:37 stop:453 length:417 start_codon:yes stop_codon:yes gene_type:complete